jgi:glycosyltransferase involved in cell wall biosynthesis
MRIAIYAGCFRENQDGATKTLYQLVRSLLAEEIETGVWAYAITPQKNKALKSHLIFSLPLPLYPDYRIAIPQRKLQRQLNAFRPDLIHVTVPDLAGLAFLNYAKKNNIPIVASFHTDFASYLKYYGLSFLFRTTWKYMAHFYNRCRWVYAPTEMIADKMLRWGVKRIRLWPRGIDRSSFHPRFRSEARRKQWGANDKKVILYAGRFVPYKDLDIFMRVYKLFKEKNPDKAVIVLAGDGPMRNELEDEMPEAIFTGYLSGQDLASVYASADILLFPSTTETLGNVVQEGLSSGLPAVVSDVGGCREVVEKADGGLVAKAGHAEAFYEHCLRLIEDDAFYRLKRENGLKYSETRSWDEINGRFIADYFSLCDQKARR